MMALRIMSGPSPFLSVWGEARGPGRRGIAGPGRAKSPLLALLSGPLGGHLDRAAGDVLEVGVGQLAGRDVRKYDVEGVRRLLDRLHLHVGRQLRAGCGLLEGGLERAA